MEYFKISYVVLVIQKRLSEYYIKQNRRKKIKVKAQFFLLTEIGWIVQI